VSSSQLRIAWFSDLSLGRPESLSTYCSRLLLPELLKHHSIEVFSDEAANVGSGGVFGAPVFHYLNAYKRHAERPFDLFLYQLEDSRACRFIRGHIGLVPGVVWVHDLFCNDLGPEACHTSPWERTIRQFFDPALEFADRSKAPHQLWPRVFRESSLCPVVLCSSTWALHEFRRMVSNRLESSDGMHRSQVVPVPVIPRRVGVEIGRSERSPFRIATLSVPGIEGRSHKILPILRQLRADWGLTWMLDEHEREAALALVREFGIEEARVTFVTSRTAERWSEVVSKSDVALHLHTSPFGHLAPFVQISLAHGCPVVVARSAQGEDFPEDVAFRINPGVHESSELRAVLAELMKNRTEGYGALGFQYANECFNVAGIANLLSETLVEVAPHVSYVMDRWHAIGRRARVALLGEVRALVTAGEGDVVNAYEKVLRPGLIELGWAS
jgi:hypothetical protein